MIHVLMQLGVAKEKGPFGGYFHNCAHTLCGLTENCTTFQNYFACKNDCSFCHVSSTLIRSGVAVQGPLVYFLNILFIVTLHIHMKNLLRHSFIPSCFDDAVGWPHPITSSFYGTILRIVDFQLKVTSLYSSMDVPKSSFAFYPVLCICLYYIYYNFNS